MPLSKASPCPLATNNQIAKARTGDCRRETRDDGGGGPRQHASNSNPQQVDNLSSPLSDFAQSQSLQYPNSLTIEGTALLSNHTTAHGPWNAHAMTGRRTVLSSAICSSVFGHHPSRMLNRTRPRPGHGAEASHGHSTSLGVLELPTSVSTSPSPSSVACSLLLIHNRVQAPP